MSSTQFEYDDDDEFETQQDEGPAALRKALKKAEKERKALLEELAGLRSETRQRTVKETLEAKGINTKVASLIPSDVTSPEQVAQWLDQYADVFGFNQATTEEVDPDRSTVERVRSATSTAIPTGKEDDLAARVAGAKSREELDTLIFGQSLGR